MLDPIIASYKLTTNVYSYLLEYSKYPVDNTYNKTIDYCQHCSNFEELKFATKIVPFRCMFRPRPGLLQHSKKK